MTGYMEVKQTEMRKYALSWLDLTDPIIELGCSDGNFAVLLKDHGFKSYVGIDILTNKIEKAKTVCPDMNFVCCNILNNLHMIKRIQTFVSFQCLEHIKEDLTIIQSLPVGCKVIISVPNRPYKGHVRWFELDGWTERFVPYIDFTETITIQHPRKVNNRSFLFRGVRNGHTN